MLLMSVYDQISPVGSPPPPRVIDAVLKSTRGAFPSVKRLTVPLRRGVFARLMNQRCSERPNRCCFPSVSREVPTPSCTGHLAP